MKDNKLLEEILDGARSDAERIIADAQETVRRKDLEFEAETVKKRGENDSLIEQKKREIESRTESSLRAEKRRYRIRMREEVLSMVMDRIRERLESEADKPGYRKILAFHTAEGIIALDSDEVSVSCSHRESLDEGIIADAAGIVGKYNGRKVKIHPEETPHGKSPGVIVKTPDGRTSYDNRLAVRMNRKSEEIKKLIFSELDKE